MIFRDRYNVHQIPVSIPTILKHVKGFQGKKKLFFLRWGGGGSPFATHGSATGKERNRVVTNLIGEKMNTMCGEKMKKRSMKSTN